MTPDLYFAYGALAVLFAAFLIGGLIMAFCASGFPTGGFVSAMPPMPQIPPMPPPPMPRSRELSAWEQANGVCPTCGQAKR